MLQGRSRRTAAAAAAVGAAVATVVLVSCRVLAWHAPCGESVTKTTRTRTVDVELLIAPSSLWLFV